MARICIVTASALGSNPRVVKEAQALTEAGHKVHVIAIRTLSLVDLRDDDILRDAQWTCERLDLRKASSWRVRRLAQLALRGLARVSGLIADGALSPMTPALIRAATARTADLFIAHYDAALPAAARAARRCGGLYAFDAEDFHPGDLPNESANAFDLRLIKAIETRNLPGCAYVTAASPGIADAYATAYGLARPTVVLNTFPMVRSPERATRSGAATPGPSIYWISQTIGPDRGLECAVRAIALSSARPHLYCRGHSAPGFAERLTALAAAQGVSERLHLLTPEPPSQMEALAASYDVGLVGETGCTPNRAIALTNKQFTYLAAGIPAVMSDIPAHRTFAAEAPDAAFLFETDSETSLAQCLDHLLGDADGLARARQSALTLGRSRFNWEVDRVKLLDQVSLALQRPGR